MKLRFPVLLLLGVVTILWILSVPDGFFAADFGRATIRQGELLTGYLALALMSLCMVLSLRLSRMERLFGGLDQMYHTHKVAGIVAGVLVIIHWQFPDLVRLLVDLSSFGRGSGGHSHSGIHDFTKGLGEWAAMIMLALVAIALSKRIPYRFFRYSHRAFAVVFLMVTFHSLVLLPANAFATPVGIATFCFVFAGTIAAVLSLTGRIGRSHLVVGTVSSVTRSDSILDIECHVRNRWPGHKAGQFAFVTFDSKEGQHPFTISSAWTGDGNLRFSIKALGDYTHKLLDSLQVGTPVWIEGPYGCFDFKSNSNHQTWVAGGIGVTPFLARLESLAAEGRDAENIDFYYCVQSRDNAPHRATLEDLCRRTGVRLHLIAADTDGFLDFDTVAATLEGKPEPDVWFCGPKAFGDSLYRSLHRKLLGTLRFHREAFDIR